MSSEDILSQAPPIADVRIPYGTDGNQFAELRIPTRPIHTEGSAFPPLALVIHGGFWRAKYNLMHAGHLCVALTKAGIPTLNVEYRRVGNLGGGWPGSLQDVEAAFQFISATAKERRFDLNRVVVIGHSAGGQLALALASRHPALRGVVALAPVSDLRHAYDLHLSNDAVVEFLGGTPTEVPQQYEQASPMELAITVPQIIIHGTQDDTVPVAMSRSYVGTKTSRGENANLIELDCGHFELIDPTSAVWPRVQRTILALLQK